MDCLFQPGDGLGGYRLTRLLGAGGFAEVYEAIDRAGERRALKVLKPAATHTAQIRAGLAREAAALTNIEHANVVRLYEAGIEEEYVYLVLEMVEGVTLADKIADPLTLAPIEDVVRWIHQASEGVAEAHRQGVIHRDLKPANILVTQADIVKVIDFGIAQLRTWSSGPHQENVLGTALYMAPEQLHALPSDARADVYAMGVILYEALSGAHPLGIQGAAPTVFQVFQQHLLGEPRALRDVAPDVPPELADIVHRALAKDPARRTPSMRALADGLGEILGRIRRERRASVQKITSLGYGIDAGPLSSPDPSSSRPPPPRSSRPRFSSIPGPVSIRSVDDGVPPVSRTALPPPEPSATEVSPLATTYGREPDRSALPPPPPSEPTAPEARQSIRTSTPRAFSAIPVVADPARPSTDGAHPLRRRAFQAVAVLLLVLATAALWQLRRVPDAAAPRPSAAPSLGSVLAPVGDAGAERR
jgi:eukaryotic-like serine/threonine-protein kinase